MPNIDELVEDYGKKDAEIKAIKKIADEEKEQIKDFLASQSERSYSAGGYTVTRVVTETETLNEERLLPILKRYWSSTHGSMQCPFIKTMEYIDMDALESAIYQKELTPSVLTEMDTCREVKTTVKLLCKKTKEA